MGGCLPPRVEGEGLGQRELGPSLGRGAPGAVSCRMAGAQVLPGGQRKPAEHEEGLQQQAEELRLSPRVLGSHGRVLRRGGL